MTVTITLDDTVLERRFAYLERVRSWPEGLLGRFETFIREADDFDLFRINPIKFAKDHGADENDVVDLFLNATRNGIVRMDWNLRCPSCGGIVGSFDSLYQPLTRLQCALCDVDEKVSLDDHVVIGFTVDPVVRRIAPHQPADLSLEDALFRCRFGSGGRYPGGQLFSDWFRKRIKRTGFLEPGAEPIVDLELEEGTLVIFDPLQNVSTRLPVRPGKRVDAEVVFAGGAMTVQPPELAPGPICISLQNKGERRTAALLIQLPPGDSNAMLEFDPFLSGSRVLNSGTFRELYGSEVPPEDAVFEIRDVTILFSNLHASTDLCERMGDTRAFSMVRGHFEPLGRAVTTHHGAVIKTVGDMVMASFNHPIDALEAGYEMLREIEALNEALGEEAIALKIGIHRGPAVAVTLNDRLDYFGQTVNVAARVQAIAGAGDICMTSDVWADPRIKERCQNRVYNKFEAHVKGVNRSVNIYVLRLVM